MRYLRFDSFMLKYKYIRSNYYCCVYVKQLYSNTFIYIFLYVDDILFVYIDMNHIDLLKGQLKEEFGMKDLGLVKRILGMNIIQNRDKIKLFASQKDCLSKVVRKINTYNSKLTSVPLVAQFKPSSAMSPTSKEEKE